LSPHLVGKVSLIGEKHCECGLCPPGWMNRLRPWVQERVCACRGMHMCRIYRCACERVSAGAWCFSVRAHTVR
jgi:hypothetical protein